MSTTTIRPAAECDIDGCIGLASVHVVNPRRRICSQCAEDLNAAMTAARYPRCALVLQMTAVAEALRQAATELDDLAAALPAYELGTARRKALGIVAAALAFAQGTVSE